MLSRLNQVPNTIAAVDMGSNSFHLVIARVVDGVPEVIDRLQERVQLAAGLERKKRIQPDAWDRALACLSRFGERLSGTPAGAVRAVGTDTLRVAKNARQFIEEANEALGHPIEVISGPEEARLVYRGVVQDLPHEDGRRQLVIDIGGGSTEVVLGTGLDHEHATSLHMGCVSFSRTHFPEGKITEKRMKKATIAARLQYERLRGPYFKTPWDRAVGSSGTIRAVAAILRENGWSDGPVTQAGIKKLKKALIKAGHIDNLGSLNGLKPARQSVIAGGLAILDGAFETLKIDELTAASGALREGVMYDLLGRFSQQDVREHTIRQMMARFLVDEDQAERVSRTAMGLLDMSAWFDTSTRPAARRYLQWAARLHEVGLAVSFHSYHKHGAYLIANSAMSGFSRDEQRMLANLVLAHRRKLARPEIDDAPKLTRTYTRQLAVILRIAVRLNRTRSWRPLPDIQFTTNERSVSVGFPNDFLSEHPMTQTDFANEAAYLAAAGIALTVS